MTVSNAFVRSRMIKSVSSTHVIIKVIKRLSNYIYKRVVGRYNMLEAIVRALNNAMLIEKADQTFMYYLFKDLRETC